VVAVFLLLGAAFVGLEHSSIRRKWQLRPKSEEQVKARDFVKYHAKNFTVANVVDGDTIDIDVPDGRYGHTRIRLLGIDAPETRSQDYGAMYFGAEAGRFAEELSLGQRVTVYLDEGNPTRGKYGRLLAYVELPDGSFLNEVLVSEGFAYADLRFPHSFYHKYRQLEASARSLKRGLWQEVSREQLPEWLRERKPKLLNK